MKSYPKKSLLLWCRDLKIRQGFLGVQPCDVTL